LPPQDVNATATESFRKAKSLAVFFTKRTTTAPLIQSLAVQFRVSI
jgi:hypothetical protein